LFELKVLDPSGRLIRRHRNISGEEFILRKDGLSSGVYYLHLNASEKTKRTKIIIQ